MMKMCPGNLEILPELPLCLQLVLLLRGLQDNRCKEIICKSMPSAFVLLTQQPNWMEFNFFGDICCYIFDSS